MLNVNCLESKNVIRLSPEGKLEKKDFEYLNTVLDTYINSHDKIPALLIHAEELPSWNKFGDFLAHIKFVNNAQKLVPKVAFVSDAKLVNILPLLTRHFVKAKIRNFPENKMEQALAWASASGDHPWPFPSFGRFSQ